MKKFLSIILVSVVLIVLNFNVCWAENINVTANPMYMYNQDISTYEYYRPTQYYDLTQGDYHFEGSADLSG